MLHTFTQQNFDKDVIRSDVPVLVDLWAPWCGPCKMIGPIIDKLSNTVTGVKIGKVDVDNESELAQALNVTAIPTLIIFKNGKEVGRTQGFRSEPQLIEFINKHK